MVNTSIMAALHDCFLFEGLGNPELQSLADECHVVHRREGESLFHEGEPATYFYVLLSGQVQAFKTSAEGKEMILHLFHTGEIFAEFPVFSGQKSYPVSTLCLKDSTLLAIHGAGFRRLAEAHTDILLKMLMRLSERLRYFTSLVEDLSLRNVDSRLAKYLLEASRTSPHEAAIAIQKKTLAAILGTVPETLSRTLKKMSGDGLIAVKGNTVRICNRHALQALADVAEIDTSDR